MADRYDQNRPRGDVGTTGMEHARLEHLSDLDDFKVADEDPDIRGWDVKTSDGRKIGEVEDLIVDTGLRRVRYMEVKLDRKAAGLDEDRHVLVPIGTARLDDDDDNVLLGTTATALRGIPGYTRGRLNREYETTLLSGFAGGTAPKATSTANFYDRNDFDEKRFWGQRRRGRENEAYLTLSEEELALGKRKVKAGEVDVRKRVETEHVRESVPVTKEEVTVERRPATPGMKAEPNIGKDEVRIPLTEEEVVVEKRAVPKEEIVVKKHATTETKNVEADLKKERVEVDKKGNIDRERRP